MPACHMACLLQLASYFHYHVAWLYDVQWRINLDGTAALEVKEDMSDFENNTPLCADTGTAPLSGKKIIVSGAGIAGLAFVISVCTLWRDELGPPPQITVYEREDQESNYGRDGYSLGVRGDERSGGAQALARMGLLDRVRHHSIRRRCDERGYFGIWSRDWHRLEKLRDGTAKPKQTMRIARAQLRQVLFDAVPEYVDIIWNTSCISMLSAHDGGVRVALSNGCEVECDVLVVADGANSKLRTCVRPHDDLNFAGPISISAVSDFSGPLPKSVSHDWGIVPSGSGEALFASSMGRTTANWSLSFMENEPREECRQPLAPEMCSALLDEARRRGAMFSEPFQTLLDKSDSSTIMVFNAMDKEPFAHCRANSIPAGMVFIGDSNHAVSPFAGNGANLALQDGYDLAECLCKHASLDQAVQAYDEKSMPRALLSLRESRTSIAVVHSSGLTWVFYRCLLNILAEVMSTWYRCKTLVSTTRKRS